MHRLFLLQEIMSKRLQKVNVRFGQIVQSSLMLQLIVGLHGTVNHWFSEHGVSEYLLPRESSVLINLQTALKEILSANLDFISCREGDSISSNIFNSFLIGDSFTGDISVKHFV